MKQVLQAPNSSAAVVRDVPAPACAPGGVLVRNAFSLISSGTERSRVELSGKSLLGKARERPDLVREVIARARREGWRATGRAVQLKLSEEMAVGYSSAGRVLELGEHVRGLRPGDAVACAGGGHANHAEIVSVPGNLCARVPDGVPLEAAAFTTVAAIALHGVRLADAGLGTRAGVVGCGLVGQIALRLLRCAGAETYALDIDRDRVAEAKRAGADHGYVIDESTASRMWRETGGVGLDCVLVAAAASSADPLRLGAAVARDHGTMVLIGTIPLQLDRAPLYDKELTFRVSRSYGPGRYDAEYEERGLDYPIGFVRWTEQRNMECVLDLQARGRLVLADLIEEMIPVEEASRAYARLVGTEGRRPKGALVLSFGSHNGAKRLENPELAASLAPLDTSFANQEAKPAVADERQLRLGLIGPGSFANRVLVPAFAAAGCVLESVGGGSGPSAEAATRTLGFARASEATDTLIGEPNVDVVAVCTRHGSHSELARRALMAGKHVFCEKPLALTYDDLNAVLEAAVGARGTLAVGFNRRHAPLLREMKQFLEAHDQPLIASFRVSAGRLDGDHWVHDLSQGGGRALGEACHFVDSLVFIAGSSIAEVHAIGYGMSELPVQARDNLVIGLSFENGSVGSIVYAADGSSRVPKERLEVFSDDRTAILDDFVRLELFGPGGRAVSHGRTQDKGHREEVRAFIAGVRSGSPPVPLGELANVSLATLAVVESMRTGASVRLR